MVENGTVTATAADVVTTSTDDSHLTSPIAAAGDDAAAAFLWLLVRDVGEHAGGDGDALEGLHAEVSVDGGQARGEGRGDQQQDGRHRETGHQEHTHEPTRHKPNNPKKHKRTTKQSNINGVD